MNRNWFRATLLSSAVVVSALIASCGGGSVVQALSPSRVITFGDSFADVGQTGSVYTVNDGTQNVWAARLAGTYSATITPSAAGGFGYAQGNARIDSTVDAAGGAVPSIKAQIDTFLASNTFNAKDLVIMNGGLAELIALNSASPGTIEADASAAGTKLAAQIRRLVNAGAKYVAVSGVYNMGETPWAARIGRTTALANASANFNTALLVGLVDLGANVLYLDAAYYFHLVHYSVTDQGGGYGIGNVTGISCTSTDPGNGIGTGAGQVNSSKCTTATLDAGVNYNTSMFADEVHVNPVIQRQWGDQTITKIRARW